MWPASLYERSAAATATTLLSPTGDALLDPSADDHVRRLVLHDGGHLVDLSAQVVTTKASLFKYYKDLYVQLGLYDQYKLQIYSYLVATAKDLD